MSKGGAPVSVASASIASGVKRSLGIVFVPRQVLPVHRFAYRGGRRATYVKRCGSAYSGGLVASAPTDLPQFAATGRAQASPSARDLLLPPLLPLLIRGDDDGDGEEVFGAACFGFDSGQRRQV